MSFPGCQDEMSILWKMGFTFEVYTALNFESLCLHIFVFEIFEKSLIWFVLLFL